MHIFVFIRRGARRRLSLGLTLALLALGVIYGCLRARLTTDGGGLIGESDGADTTATTPLLIAIRRHFLPKKKEHQDGRI